MEMKLTKNQVVILNTVAKKDFGKAKAMLTGINMVLGTQYGWLAGRVHWFEKPNGTYLEQITTAHDAWPWAKDD